MSRLSIPIRSPQGAKNEEVSSENRWYTLLTKSMIDNQDFNKIFGQEERFSNFIDQNLGNLDIMNKYCEELQQKPYDDNLEIDIMAGRWLEELIVKLSKDIIDFINHYTKIKIDTSIIDIYKNYLILISQRYDIILLVKVRGHSTRL
jgi:hypothetical protein